MANGNGADDRILVALPIAINIEVPEALKGATQLQEVLSQAIDDATLHITTRLDELITEIKGMKTKVIEHSGQAKAVISEHFTLGSEAAIFTENIRAKLNTIIIAAQDVNKV